MAIVDYFFIVIGSVYLSLLQVHIGLAIVKFWPAFKGSITPMCISVSFVRHMNILSVEINGWHRKRDSFVSLLFL